MAFKVFDKIYKIELPVPFPIGTINVFFIDESPKTIIDTGIKTEESLLALNRGLREIGYELRSLERILITHGHIDHYGQAKRIFYISGAPIHIHSKEYGRIRSFIHSFGFLRSILLRNGIPESMIRDIIHQFQSAQIMGDSLDEAFFLKDGDRIDFKSMNLEVIECPGHSPGMLCFFWPEKKILFSGDHILKEITPNPTLNVSEYTPPFHYPSLKEYLTSLKKIERLDISLILPGHGEEILDPKGLIKKLFNHHEERMNNIIQLLSREDKTAFQIATELFPNIPAFEVFLGVSEVLGHLEILREQGKIRIYEREGKDYYSLE